MEVTVPLYRFIVVSSLSAIRVANFKKVGKVDRVASTYTLPVAKVKITPILSLVDSWSLHIHGIGRKSIMTSVMILGKLPHLQKAFISMQRAWG